MGISPNEPDSKLVFGEQCNSANQPIRAPRVSNETSSSAIHFPFRWSRQSIEAVRKVRFFGHSIKPELSLISFITASDALLHCSRQHSRTFAVFYSHFDKTAFIEYFHFSSIFVLGRGTLHLPACYVVLYRVPFNLSCCTVNLLPLRY